MLCLSRTEIHDSCMRNIQFDKMSMKHPKKRTLWLLKYGFNEMKKQGDAPTKGTSPDCMVL